MSDRESIPLSPILLRPDDPEFTTIRDWRFVDDYVGRMLREDIPQRVLWSDKCRI